LFKLQDYKDYYFVLIILSHRIKVSILYGATRLATSDDIFNNKFESYRSFRALIFTGG